VRQQPARGAEIRDRDQQDGESRCNEQREHYARDSHADRKAATVGTRLGRGRV
jgi:hypothetical protein